jgi:hypothetical protein
MEIEKRNTRQDQTFGLYAGYLHKCPDGYEIAENEPQLVDQGAAGGTLIIPKSREMTLYPPMRVAGPGDLHRQFRRAMDKGSRGILEFAGRYGLLGVGSDRAFWWPEGTTADDMGLMVSTYMVLSERGWPEGPPAQDMLPALTGQMNRLGLTPDLSAADFSPLSHWNERGPIVIGEPLDIWKRHQQEVAALTELLDLIRSEDPRDRSVLGGYFRERTRGRIEVRLGFDGRNLTSDREKSPFVWISNGPWLNQQPMWHQPGSTLDVRRAAKDLLVARVNERIQEHVVPGIFESGEGRFIELLWPRNLLGAIYLSLAFEIQGKNAGQKRCARDGCDKLFVPRRSDGIYCTKKCSDAAHERRRGKRKRARNTPTVPQHAGISANGGEQAESQNDQNH